jgi:hypothetical protein
VDLLATLFTIDIQGMHGFTLLTDLLSTYQIQNVFERNITLFKV